MHSATLHSRNNLSTLPPSLCSLSALSSLKLDYNKLTQLPNEFEKLVKLEELDISHNVLTSLPDSIGELTCLLRLSASHNQLDRIPDSVGSMRGTVLDVPLVVRERGIIFHSSVLKEVLLNNNKLTTLPTSM